MQSPQQISARTDFISLPLVEPGQFYDATLKPTVNVSYAVQPGKAVAANLFGGMFRIDMPSAARVGIALSGAAWVDAVHDGVALVSNSYGHGPACSTIRKIVWFELPAGETIIQLTDAAEQSLHIMAATD